QCVYLFEIGVIIVVIITLCLFIITEVQFLFSIFPQPGPRYLWIPVLLRTIIFIPFFLSCNFGIENPHLSVLITNDHIYVLGCILFAFSNGHLASLDLSYSPSYLLKHYSKDPITNEVILLYFKFLFCFVPVCVLSFPNSATRVY
ncbi:unnamed protein product, partial [Schistosoma mattheei]